MYVQNVNSGNSFGSLWMNHDARRVFDRALTGYCRNLEDNVDLFGLSSEEVTSRAKTIAKFAEIKNAFAKSRVANLTIYMDSTSNSKGINALIGDIDFVDSKGIGFILAGSVRKYDNVFDFVKGIVTIAENKKDSLHFNHLF